MFFGTHKTQICQQCRTILTKTDDFFLKLAKIVFERFNVSRNKLFLNCTLQFPNSAEKIWRSGKKISYGPDIFQIKAAFSSKKNFGHKEVSFGKPVEIVCQKDDSFSLNTQIKSTNVKFPKKITFSSDHLVTKNVFSKNLSVIFA